MLHGGRYLQATLFASVPGEGSIELTWDGQEWAGHNRMSSHATLYLRFRKDQTLRSSFDNVEFTVAACSALGAAPPPYRSLSFRIVAAAPAGRSETIYEPVVIVE
ncbi:MAG TPA: hypothetical protein VHR66_15230 [Gemmataceae bacterium]|nr:hypothetical protein [Gemmataceae bacterium]